MQHGSATEFTEIRGLIGVSRSEMDGAEDKFYSERFGRLVLDYEGDSRFDPQHDYNVDPDSRDPTNWRAHEIDIQDTGRDYSFFTMRLDGEYSINNQISLAGGLSYKKFDHDGFRASENNLYRDVWESGELSDDISSLAYPVTDHYAARWIGVDVRRALQALGASRDAGLPDPNENFTIRENSFGAYAEVQYDSVIAGVPLRCRRWITLRSKRP